MDTTLQAFLIFLGLIVVGVAAYLAYAAYYTRRVNKVLEKGAGDGPIPEPRKAGKLILGFGVAACVLGFFIWASRLETRLKTLQQEIWNGIGELSQTVDDNYRSLISELEEQSRLFTSLDWELAAINDDGTLDLRVTAVPKSASPTAAASIRSEDSEAVLERNADGNFTGILSHLPASEGDWRGDVTLTLTENGQSRTQTEPCSAMLRGKLLPFVTLNAYCTVENGVTTAIEGWIETTREKTSLSAVTVRLVRNGETVCEKLLEEAWEEYGYDTFDSFSWKLDKPLGPKECLLVVLIFDDSLGYHHVKNDQFFVGGRSESYWTLDFAEEGELPEGYPADVGRELISTADGKLLLDLSRPY